MSQSYISLVLRRQIHEYFHGRCAYCHTAIAITGAHLVFDHIVPEASGGKTELTNLCEACHACNEFKGKQEVAQDPLTGEIVPLFHPHRQPWREQFMWSDDGTRLIGRSATGRATILALKMNHPDIVEARARWVSVGWHPPEEDL